MRCLYPSLFDPRKNVEVWFCDASCCNGKQFHRDDGPAVILPDGPEEWWQHGKKLTDAEVSALRGELLARQMHEGTQCPVKPMRLGRVSTTPISRTRDAMKKDDQDEK
jgi:hypothetical protein